MRASGGDVRQLTDHDARDMMPAWSPDGKQIAFVSDRDGNDEIYLMDLRGTSVQHLTEHPAADWFPVWSPDGSQLLFSSNRDGNLEVYVMDADGGNVRRLTHSPGDDFNAVWQPVPPPSGEPQTWIKTYDSDPVAAAQDAVPSGDGGYLLVGSTNYSHQDTAAEDIHLMKIDAGGEGIWEKTYGGDRFDRGRAIIPSPSGGFVILAETESFSAGGRDLYLLQVDEEGNELWSRTFGGEQNEEGFDVQETPDGGFLVLAQATQGEAVYVNQEPDILLLRIDGSGDELWPRLWATEEVDGGHVLLPTADGAYLIAGITAPAGNQSQIDVLLVKVDAEGNQIWNKRLGDRDAADYASDALELPSGDTLLTGLFNQSGRGAIPLMRIDAAGEVRWSRNLAEGRGNKVGMRLLPAPSGVGTLIVGLTDQLGRGFQTIVIKTDSEGNVQE